MLNRILGAYTFGRQIHRLDLLVGFVFVVILVGLCAKLLTSAGIISEAPSPSEAHLNEVVIGLVVIIFATPLFVARLKDLGWSPAWVILYLIPVVFSLRNLTVVEAEFGDAIFLNQMRVFGMLLLPVYLLMLGTLFLRHGKVEYDV